MNWYKSLFLGVIVIGITLYSPLHADDIIERDNLHFKHLTIEDGLSNNRVSCVCQDSLGYIWFGTDEGLNKYDGYSIFEYQHNVEDTSSLSSNSVSSLFLDSKNNLWIGLSADLNRYDPKNNSFIKHTYRNNQFDVIRDFFEDDEGRIWVCSKNGLFIIDPDDFSISSYAEENPEFDLKQIHSFYIDSKKNKWIGTYTSGLFYIKAGSNKLNHVTQTSNYRVEALAQDNNNYLWAGTSNNNLVRVSIDDFSSKSFIVDKNNELTSRVRGIYVDKSGNLWLATRSGLYLKPNDEDIFILMGNTDMKVSKLSYNSIFKPFIDKSDVLWLGTFAGGVNYADLQQKKFRNIGKDESGNSQGLNDESVYSIIEDYKENIWIGTEDGGVNHFNKKTGQFSYYSFDYNNKKDVIRNIHAFEFASPNQLWIGTSGYGLISFDIEKKTNEVILIESRTSNDDANDVYSLLYDSKDTLWVGTRQGLFYKKNNSVNHFERIDTIFPNDVVEIIYEDSKSNLWIGTQENGLFFYNRDTFVRIAPERIESILSILEDTKGNMWFGGSSNGLMVMTNDTIVYYNKNDGIPNNSVYGILEDNDNNIWISSSSGISKLENAVISPIIEKPDFIRYDMADGLISKQFNHASYLKSSDGKLYFGNLKGITYFDPNEIKENDKLPNVVISKFSISNNPIFPNKEYKSRVFLNSDISVTKEITLSYKENVFSLEFVSLHYANPQQNKYKYMLEGFDNEWTYTDANRRFTTYTNLPGGTYIFKVYGTNYDGIWSENPAELVIKIIPPFWKTLLFQIFIILFIVGLIISFYFYRLRAIHRQKDQLAEQVEKRTLELANKNTILNQQTEELNKTNTDLKDRQLRIETISKELMAQKKQLEELNATKDKFFKIISHDLRSPFNGIVGLTKLLNTEYDSFNDTKRKEFIQKINASALYTYNLLENLLTWASTQTDEIIINKEKLNLKELVAAGISTCLFNADSKNIHVINNVQSELIVSIDRNTALTFIRNIVSNAIKFTHDGGHVTIDSHLDEDSISLHITDNGVGMSPKLIENLFQIDKEISTRGTNNEKGTGLGLILCKEFIERNGGSIIVKSEINKGSEFIISLPR